MPMGQSDLGENVFYGALEDNKFNQQFETWVNFFFLSYSTLFYLEIISIDSGYFT